ncbi:hypothetical protein BDV36DRAFT_274515 [Aspergillus pseudocaelatus]|uniref:Uncharacterized protein n=1 Tax=Aspergillus pseudocaelatus TaxID=1825620 RepID=A0ABQ6W5W3_9EURO|nr:hypothetical protein BDV36DRAFT_274515 [Aspergillus pseudocaelatus]
MCSKYCQHVECCRAARRNFWRLYPTSKGTIANMTRAMLVNHKSQRVRVNRVCPGRSPPHTCSTICFNSLTHTSGESFLG